MHPATRQAMRERPARSKRPTPSPKSHRTIAVWVAKPTRRIDPETARNGEW